MGSDAKSSGATASSARGSGARDGGASGRGARGSGAKGSGARDGGASGRGARGSGARGRGARGSGTHCHGVHTLSHRSMRRVVCRLCTVATTVSCTRSMRVYSVESQEPRIAWGSRINESWHVEQPYRTLASNVEMGGVTLTCKRKGGAV